MALIKTGQLESYCHFILSIDQCAVAAAFFSRSKTKVRGMAANLGKQKLKVYYRFYETKNSDGWSSFFSPMQIGREKITYCMSISREIGGKLLITTEAQKYSDLYEYLMTNYKLPLLRNWMEPLLNALVSRSYAFSKSLQAAKGNPQEEISITLNGNPVNLSDLICYDFSFFTEEKLEEVVSCLLREKSIQITDKNMRPLNFTDFDSYVQNYGHTIVENLNKEIHPLSPLEGNVENLALKTMRLFPQQAACVNGAAALKQNSKSYVVLNEGMGVGKTIQALSFIESAEVTRHLQKHPELSLKDVYKSKAVCYRAIIIAPGLLVEKWKREIESEIPDAQAVIISRFSQLTDLQKRGKKARGKEFFIISKDFAKLDTQQSPIPTKIKKKYIAASICADCKEEEDKIVWRKGVGTDAVCPECGGKRFVPFYLTYAGRHKGLVCPKCGELLIRYRKMNPDISDEDIGSLLLQPQHFAKHKSENSFCFHCNTSLWGCNAKPIVPPGQVPKQPLWHKVSHFTNFSHKQRTSAFVLKGHESEYCASVTTIGGWKEFPSPFGPRKVSPAHYVKKHLRGFFDYCILDEAHKYLSQSAQALAAHTFVKASRFTVALTGTISNGTAESFYYLFWMLDPKKMLQHGYHYYGSHMDFCYKYGCVETLYSVPEENGLSYNSNSRGIQISSPKVKPGISPVLLGDFLIDCCIFLDISDLSRHLPPLKEHVVLCDVPEDLALSYQQTLSTLKERGKKKCGMAALSEMLLFGLSYLDKPYGRNSIMNPYHKNKVLADVRNYPEYENTDTLLPKEEKLIEIVQKEIAEDRSCFVYATFTGKEETNVTFRLKTILENHCSLQGKVEIIQSASPAASQREAFFHERAAEGVRVFITNPANVETGLDFCFAYQGKDFNFPTLIFYQISAKLEEVWQASRRAYRINQTRECRNYYLAYSDTLQSAILAIMAQKQVATAAIQGHFSAEGLSSMAKGVDVRTQLAAALSKNDMGNRESLENMFDILSESSSHSENSAFESFTPSLTYSELLGEEDTEKVSGIFQNSHSFDEIFSLFLEMHAAANSDLEYVSGSFSPEKTKTPAARRANRKSRSGGQGIKQLTLLDMSAAL